MKRIQTLQIVFVLLAILLSAGCELSKPPLEQADKQLAAKPKADIKPVVKEEKIKPPPLMKPIDGSSMSIDQLVQAMDNATVKQNPEALPILKITKKKEKKKYIYKWIDKSGTPHISSDLSSVPLSYRKTVKEIELKSSGNREQTKKKYKAGGGTFYKKYLKENKRKKKGYERWNKRYKSALKRVKNATAARVRAEKNMPSCAFRVIYGQTKVSSTTCEYNWKKKVERLKKREKQAIEKLAKLKEDARRAGVPPGYMR